MSYNGLSGTKTDSSGTFSVIVQAGAEVSLEIWRAEGAPFLKSDDIADCTEEEANELAADFVAGVRCYKFGPFANSAAPGDMIDIGELRLDTSSLCTTKCGEDLEHYMGGFHIGNGPKPASAGRL